MGITKRPPEPPQIPYLVVSSGVIDRELLVMMLEPMYPCLLDASSDYSYTTDKGWRSVAAYVYSSFRWPAAIPARKDCDFFAMLFMSLVHCHFGLNGCGFAIGQTDLGQHAFNIVRSDTGWWLWEPNPSIRRSLNLHDYFRPSTEWNYTPLYRLI